MNADSASAEGRDFVGFMGNQDFQQSEAQRDHEPIRSSHGEAPAADFSLDPLRAETARAPPEWRFAHDFRVLRFWGHSCTACL
jgi:hypothetical protein